MEGGAMGQVLHGSARTTAAVRRAIQHSQESLRVLAKRHGINPKRWPNGRSAPRSRTSAQGPELLELGKEGLDQVPGLVEVFVKGARCRAGLARWDHRRLAGFGQRFAHPRVGIERFVGDERLGLAVSEISC